MKLYDVPRGSKIEIIEGFAPPGGPLIKAGDIMNFSHIDGMYSVCFRDGERVYLNADANVKIIT